MIKVVNRIFQPFLSLSLMINWLFFPLTYGRLHTFIITVQLFNHMTINSKYNDLSDLDIEILKKLSEDDRISYRQLGRDLDKRSPITIKKHVEELQKSGIIKNYSVKLDYEKLGYNIIALIEITISKGKMFDVEERVAQNPNVFGVYDITGTFDALILARFRTREDLSKMIKEELHTSPYVEHTNTHIVLNIIKEGCSFTGLIEKEKKKK
ncbi:hypothetical protein LCGC14_1173590 [marine sediment metagenome]|uniref:HTH asnC-type domain-containing protein n=1 Tax=marine sediment metagenome TaxID=412755 RepID=A0A0F9LU32_9ZZZZ